MKTSKYISVFIAFVILFGAFWTPVIADEGIRVLLNGAELTFDVPPQLINDRTMVPMRRIFEALGAKVEWEGETQTIRATKDGVDIIMQIDNATMSVNGRYFTLDVPPLLINSRTLVPVRAVAESLEANVEWSNATNTVMITEMDSNAMTAITEINVGTAEEFIRALGSNRKIIMQTGVYNLSSIPQINNFDTNNIFWEEAYDGKELVLYGLNNLAIEGSGENTQIVVEPRGSYVMRFLESSNISISNLKTGHTLGGDCLGGVFSFSDCNNIRIDGTLMYGCGTVGLDLNGVVDMVVTGSVIYDCTYHIMTIEGCENILFDNCIFADNKQFDLVNIRNTKNLTIQNSEFSNNNARIGSGSQNTVFNVTSSDNIKVLSSEFTKNVAWTFHNNDSIDFQNCQFEDNDFSQPSLYYLEGVLTNDDMSAYGISLKMSVAEVERQNGLPRSSRYGRYRQHYPFVEDQVIYYYENYTVVFDNQEVIAIIIQDPEYVSSKGIKMGDSSSEVMLEYGYTQLNEVWNYLTYIVPFKDGEFTTASIVFALGNDDKVKEIMIQETGY